ncbi:MAG: flotillin family protein [Myxococcales bacterium]|nr:flotillin family protein [Myxococcales bacterium]
MRIHAVWLSAALPRGPGGIDLEPVLMVLGVAGGVLVAFTVLLLLLRHLLYICGPDQILVFAGRKHRLPDGTVSNYKILHGGRGFRMPFLESVHTMDMRLFPVELSVRDAYSKGGIPLTVEAIANVKLSSDPVAVRNAVERFLNAPLVQIAAAVQQTLEGVLREVISQLTPEEVNEDRLKFAESLVENAQDDLHKLGLQLDVLKVQHVSDDQHYLENLGRPAIAHMLRDAQNAESVADQSVAQAEAAARQAAETATKRAETTVLQTRNNARAELAKLEAEAKQVENQAQMAVETERARAEQRLQELRAELEKLRLYCDVVLPAEAQRKAAELKARGEAAPAIETGKAAAEALRAVSSEWSAAGEHGREVYLLQQLRALAAAAAERVGGAPVGSIKLVANDEQAFSAVLAAYPAAVARVLRETASALGFDLESILAGVGSRAPGPDASAPHRPALGPGPTPTPGSPTSGGGRP